MTDKSRFQRQLDLVKPTELDFKILLIGAGGIGSWSALALSKMGCQNLSVVDFDLVEDKNIPSQFYTEKQIGELKVMALGENIKQFTGTQIYSFARKWQDYVKSVGFGDTEVIISALDSMDERIALWRELLEYYYSNPGKKIFRCYIDARMGGEVLRILLVNPADPNSIKYYEENLFPSSEASQDPCTARSIVYNTFICGGMVANLVKKYAKREAVKFNFMFDIFNAVVV